MKRNRGFTLIEVIVVIAIAGILAATAIPFYNTYRMRTYGSEASVMMKQILDAEVVYILENDEYFPAPGDTLEVYSDGTTLHNGAASGTVIQDIKDAIQIQIPVGHNLDFIITNDGTGTLWVRIIAPFSIFKGIPNDRIRAFIDKNGKVTYF